MGESVIIIFNDLQGKDTPTDKPVGHFNSSADKDWRAVQVRIKHRCID